MPETPALPGKFVTIDDVARTVVARVAPDEIEHYPAVRDEYFMRGRANRAQDNPLGFGEIVVGVVTGVVLTVLHELVVESITDAARPWWNRAWRWVSRRLRLRRAPRVEAGTVLGALPQQEIPALITSVTRQAAEAGLPSDQAERLAHTIVDTIKASQQDSGRADVGPTD